jgi:anaerobic magnesium-protoporphyrin IX monomethyl ester cyclase
VRVLLVYPEPDTAPFYLQAPMECLSLAAAIEGKHEVHIYDQNVDEQRLETVLSDFVPDVICVLFTIRSLAASYRIAEQFKQQGYILMAGGKYPTFKPTDCIEKGFDIVLQGNVEQTLSDFLESLTLNLAPTLPQMQGYCFKDVQGNYINTGIAHSLDSNHYVLARHLIPQKYHRRYSHGFLIGSRGCLYTCLFCTSSRTGYKERSPSRVVDELEYIVKVEGHSAIHFGDDIFTYNPSWVIELCREIMARKIECNWSVNSRSDVPVKDWHIFDWMSQAGCKIVAFGIESADQKTLKKVRKGLKVDKILPVVNKARSANIGIRCNLIIGLPGATYEDHLLSIDLMEEIQPSQIVASLCIPYPGSKMGNCPEQFGIRFKTPNWGALLEKDYCEPNQLGHIVEYENISTENIIKFAQLLVQRLKPYGYISISEDDKRSECSEKVIKTFMDKPKLPMVRDEAGRRDHYQRAFEPDWVL